MYSSTADAAAAQSPILILPNISHSRNKKIILFGSVLDRNLFWNKLNKNFIVSLLISCSIAQITVLYTHTIQFFNKQYNTVDNAVTV